MSKITATKLSRRIQVPTSVRRRVFGKIRRQTRMKTIGYTPAEPRTEKEICGIKVLVSKGQIINPLKLRKRLAKTHFAYGEK